MSHIRCLICASFLLLLAGCSASGGLVGEKQARIEPYTTTSGMLLELPPPRGVINVSVYGFRDLTGQFRMVDTQSSLSTAVTQGSSAILLQALMRSGWFTALEREGLQNILTERKIIRAALQQQNPNADLPPLQTAQLIIDGGVVGYDSNVKTGGTGLAYAGISLSGQYREDQVSVYLRAVDVRSGRVLLSVSSNKTIYSQEVRAGFFRYLSEKRIGEFEGGYTSNEPQLLAVRQAIEKAVVALVLEGIENKLWASSDPDPRTNNLVAADYFAEKVDTWPADPYQE